MLPGRDLTHCMTTQVPAPIDKQERDLGSTIPRMLKALSVLISRECSCPEESTCPAASILSSTQNLPGAATFHLPLILVHFFWLRWLLDGRYQLELLCAVLKV